MPQDRRGLLFRIGFNHKHGIFTAGTPAGALVEVETDFNALYEKCKNQGMVYDGASYEALYRTRGPY